MKCCICKKELGQAERNNPRPVKNKGYCCDYCNLVVVIPERMDVIRGRENDKCQWCGKRTSELFIQYDKDTLVEIGICGDCQKEIDDKMEEQ
jgi:hypothetical protein